MVAKAEGREWTGINPSERRGVFLTKYYSDYLEVGF